MITNPQSGTNVHEIAAGIYRINTPVALPGAGAAFNFNQYLVADDEPLLFHTGPRRMFPLVRDAVARVVAPSRLRWISFGHVEADECGSMNEWLALAPDAQVAHGQTACSVQLDDLADRAPRLLADGDEIAAALIDRVLAVGQRWAPIGAQQAAAPATVAAAAGAPRAQTPAARRRAAHGTIAIGARTAGGQ